MTSAARLASREAQFDHRANGVGARPGRAIADAVTLFKGGLGNLTVMLAEP